MVILLGDKSVWDSVKQTGDVKTWRRKSAKACEEQMAPEHVHIILSDNKLFGIFLPSYIYFTMSNKKKFILLCFSK